LITNILTNALTRQLSAICVQLGAGKPTGALCMLSIHGPVVMNTACMLSIHSPDDVIMSW